MEHEFQHPCPQRHRRAHHVVRPPHGAGRSITSIILAVRQHLPYELWHAVHLTTYLAVALSIPHQFTMDNMFETGWARAWWIGLYAATTFSLLAYRVLLPLVRSLRLGLRVSRVEELADDVVAITITGRGVDRLDVAAGQFLHWRFWTPSLVGQQHPFSLSAAPRGNSLRITVRSLGRGTARMMELKPGTRVSVQGPYGVFTARARTRDAVVLVGSGVGIAPVRAVLEETDTLPGRSLVVLRASAPEELYHLDEVQTLCAAKGAHLVMLTGPRGDSWVPAGQDLRLTDLAPWLGQADVYLCGPRSWMELVEADARAAGIAQAQLHAERFDF
ncbi:FAD-binding protein [Luteococcus japonicus]|uniref:FAD-binding protein n=1 Tax=Luteococcus japonicus TaxID=33984 RepID=A0A3N1ZVA8_9ACTN|nr:hypothetical protein [Luteococcus japonicus]ROR54784.1 FAD-binding protein [Luteococcus japonicus]